MERICAFSRKMVIRTHGRIVRQSYRRRFYYYLGFINLLVLGTFLWQMAILIQNPGPEYMDRKRSLAERRKLFIDRNKEETDRLLNELASKVNISKTFTNETSEEEGSDYSYTPKAGVEVDKNTGYKFSILNRTSFLVSKKELDIIFGQDRNVPDVVCKYMFDAKPTAINYAYYVMLKRKRRRISNIEYLHLTLNCAKFKSMRGYFETPFTEEEENFPLAFSLLGYKNIEAIERFLRLIYRPQNYYCIHMDQKTSREDLQTIKAIAACFPNVFLSTIALDVKWGEFSVLGADLTCMKDLWRYPDWKYYINLTGQELPLKTNLELVRILMAMKWANLVDGTWIRARNNYFYRWTKNVQSPPHNIRPIKGSVHVAVNRDFVDFALHDQRSLDYLAWLNKTVIPDESFFSTLNHNPHLGIPGSFLGEPEEYARKPTFTRFKNWEVGHGVWLKSCAGKYVRNICIIGIGDLRLLKDDIGLFVNKISLDFEYLAYECLEELIYNRTRNQYLGLETVDTSFYQTLDQIRYRLVV